MKLLRTLLELQRLKRLDRTGWTLRGLPNGTESVAAHSFGVCVTAMLLADELLARGVPVNMEILLRTAIMHDWAETRVGDIPRTASKYFSTDVRKQAEAGALADIVNESTSKELYRKLYADYEHRASFEARLVKAADVIDLLVQTLAMERAGARGLDEFWQVAENADFNLDGEAQVLVKDMLQALLLARPQARN